MATEARFHECASGEPIDGLPPAGPCPFCKTVNECCSIVTCPAEVTDGIEIDATYHVQCDHCGAEGSPESSQLDAAVCWNGATGSSGVLESQRWAMMEATNLLRCISIATDHGEAVDDDLRPAIGVAIDGVVRLLSCVMKEADAAEEDMTHGR